MQEAVGGCGRARGWGRPFAGLLGVVTQALPGAVAAEGTEGYSASPRRLSGS
ncbi:MAG: hypothetical protein AAF289_10390 [Cyanobacteria bacterium P01_A01_bin.135]